MKLPIGYVALAFFLAVAGAVLAAVLPRSHKRLCALISLGAGSLLGVTAFAILPEAFAELSWWALLLALGSGYGLFFLLTRYVFHVCPACAASHFDETTTHRFGEIAAAMMFALGVHCAADGIAIAAGHDAELANAPGGRGLALSLVVAVCIHKVPEGLALGSLLLGAGFRPAAMLVRVVGVEAATLLGGVAGLLFLRNISDAWLAAVVAHAGGGFLYLAIHAVFGEIFQHNKAIVLTNFAIGFAIVGLVTLLTRIL
jgi:ZIP family zinc transporter/zinc and cadmium transporter